LPRPGFHSRLTSFIINEFFTGIVRAGSKEFSPRLTVCPLRPLHLPAKPAACPFRPWEKPPGSQPSRPLRRLAPGRPHPLVFSVCTPALAQSPRNKSCSDRAPAFRYSFFCKLGCSSASLLALSSVLSRCKVSCSGSTAFRFLTPPHPAELFLRSRRGNPRPGEAANSARRR
jgi:hypothetical protein